MKISIVVPAHNEEENLPILIDNIQYVIKKNKLDAQVVLVDDNSDDSTPAMCDSLQKKYDNILVVHRFGNRGMGNALLEGTNKASGDVIVWVMADLSDDLNAIPKFLEKIKEGYDVVFGSRFMKSGSSGDIPYYKSLASHGFTILSRIFFGINVHDITNAFRAFRKEILKSLNLKSNDYGISPEFALKAYLNGYKLSEVPVTYKNRIKGMGNFKMIKMGKRYSKILLSPLFQQTNKKIKRHKFSFYALFGYLFLTLFMTYPVIFNLNSIAGSIGDIYATIWPFSWLKKTLFELHTYPLYTYYLFYPSGVNLAFFTFSHLNSLLSLPLQSFFSLVTCYNLLFFFSFIMSGFGTFLLVKHLTKNNIAAFISGTIFAFSPYTMAEALGHIHAFSTQWMPFYVLFLIKTFETRKIRDSIIAAVFLSLTALSSFEYLLFMVIFTVIFLLYNLKDVLNKTFLSRLILMGVLFFLFVSPVAIPMIKESLSSNYMTKTLDPSVVTSADLIAFFIPSEYHTIFGQYVKNIYPVFSYQKMARVVFVGYTVLILSLYSIFKIKKTKFWAIATVCFFILSLGPVLHIYGRFLFQSPFRLGDIAASMKIRTSELGRELMNDFIGVPLPYIILYLFFPFFSVTRTPTRLVAILMLSLAVLSGYSISAILGKVGYKKKIFFSILILSLVLFEFIVVPFPLLDSSVPKFYQKIAADKEEYAIVEIPIISTVSMYYQTFHGKKIVGGSFLRRPPYTDNFVDSVPLLRALKPDVSIRKSVHNLFLENVIIQNPDTRAIIQKYIEAEGDVYSYNTTEINKTEPSTRDIETLRVYNIKYIVFDRKFLDEESFKKMNSIVRTVLNKTPVYTDEDTLVYEVF